MGGACLALCIASVIAAYPLLASVLDLIGMTESRNPAIVMRVSIAGVAVLALWFGRRELRLEPGLFLGALLLFWLAYAYRFVYEAFVVETLFSTERSPQAQVRNMLVIWVMFVLVPMTGSLLGLTRTSGAAALRWTLWLTGASAALLCYQSAEELVELVKLNGSRFELERLNPLTVGSVGSVLVILCVTGAARARRRLLMLPLALVGVIAGMFLLMVSGSRGPAVALVLTLVMYWLVPLRPARLLGGLVGVLAMVVLVFAMQDLILETFGLDVSQRYRAAADGESASVTSREISFSGAVRQFLESPIIGSSLLEKQTLSYPHNLVLEAFMTTGLIGGLAYLVCLGYLLAGVRTLLGHGTHAWLGALGFFFLISSQFSGSHHAYGPHWVSLVATVMAAAAVARERSGRPGGRRRAGSGTFVPSRWMRDAMAVRDRDRRRSGARPVVPDIVLAQDSRGTPASDPGTEAPVADPISPAVLGSRPAANEIEGRAYADPAWEIPDADRGTGAPSASNSTRSRRGSAG